MVDYKSIIFLIDFRYLSVLYEKYEDAIGILVNMNVILSCHDLRYMP